MGIFFLHHNASLPYPNVTVSLILLMYSGTCFVLKVAFPWQRPLHSEIGFDLYDVRMLATRTTQCTQPDSNGARQILWFGLATLVSAWESAELLTLKCRYLHLLGASSPGTDGVMPLLLDKSIIFSLWETYYRTSRIDDKGDSEMSGIIFIIFCYL